MRITELFDTTVDYEWSTNSSGGPRGTTMMQDKPMSVDFYPNNPESGMWAVEFDIEGETKKTGAGNELKVFAAFMQALDHVLKENHPECMWWTASVSEPTRVSMYQKLVNRAGRRNPEYTDVSMNDAAWPPALKNLIASDRKNKYSILMRNPT